jgi:cytochrome c oxidase assembly protein subunit 15
MLLALLLVGILIYVHFRSGLLLGLREEFHESPKKVEVILLVGMVLMLVQIVLGTQVREQIDQISSGLGGLLREEWVGRVGLNFLVHRSFSLVLLAVHLLYFFWCFRLINRKSPVISLSYGLMLVLLVEIISGVGMAYFGIPAFLQPLHLVFGSIILGIQFSIILQLRRKNEFKLNID